MAINFNSKRVKITIDILLLIGILGISGTTGRTWKSPHCIGASIWVLLIATHAAQHWQLMKSFTKWKVIKKNKLTALVMVASIVMLSSILLFCIGFNNFSVAYHHIAGSFFFFIVIIHIISRFKRFIALFKSRP